MNTELSLIRYNLINFFQVLMWSKPLYPTSTLLIKIVEALLSSENNPDEKIRERVDWIYANTHDKVRQPLSIVEFVVFTNIQKSFNLQRQVEIGRNQYYLIELYKYLNEIEKELSQIAIQIAKKYTFEIPITNFMSPQSGKQEGDSQSIGL